MEAMIVFGLVGVMMGVMLVIGRPGTPRGHGGAA